MIAPTQNSTYRSDIDGLRALAVLAVLLYHAKVKYVSGGYVGVDIFFVISGFLITTIIEKSIKTENFSLLGFYERRVRRIFPALFVVMIVILAAGYFLLDGSNFNELANTALSTAVSSSNFYFNSTSDYFDAKSSLNPLLHTWSLSVEEQFYLVLPLLLWGLSRFQKKNKLIILILLAILSLIFSQMQVISNPTTAFFFPQHRAWELLAGSLIAILGITVSSGKGKAVLSVIGLALIFYPIFTFTNSTRFPGTNALYPVIGTSFLLIGGSGNKGIVQKLLSLSPLRFIGNISYSLYLWHWPIFVFGKLFIIATPTTFQWVMMIATSFLLATLSWLLVENPFRNRELISKRAVFAAFVLGTAVLVIVGWYITSEKGIPDRYKSYPTLNELQKTSPNEFVKCSYYGKNNLSKKHPFTTCKFPPKSSKAEYLVWGDSYAQALFPAFQLIAKNNSIPIEVVTSPGCKPYLLKSLSSKDEICILFNNSVIDHIKANPSIKTVIISSRWFARSGIEMKTEQIGEMITVLESLGKEVIILGSPPLPPTNIVNAYFVSTVTQRDLRTIIKIPSKPAEKYTFIERTLFAHIMKTHNNLIGYIDITPAFCKEVECKFIDKHDRLLYFDDNHLSKYGAWRTIPILEEEIFGIVQPFDSQ
jgi:peptidoglycan/LPS O-acetylase OafA/YrhL